MVHILQEKRDSAGFFSLLHDSFSPTEQNTSQSRLFIYQNTRGERILEMHISQTFSEVNYKTQFILQ